MCVCEDISIENTTKLFEIKMYPSIAGEYIITVVYG